MGDRYTGGFVLLKFSINVKLFQNEKVKEKRGNTGTEQLSELPSSYGL